MNWERGYIGAIVAAGMILFILILGASFYLGRISVKPKPLPSPSVYTSQTVPLTSSTPTPISNQTLNWSIYKDPNGEFTLKYPSDWIIQHNSSSVVLTTDPVKVSPIDALSVSILVTNNDQNLTAKDYFEKVYLKDVYSLTPVDPSTLNNIISESEKPLTLMGAKNAIYVDALPGGPGTIGPLVFIDHFGTVIKLQTNNTPENIQIFKQILNTLLLSVS